jgi:ribonuclease HI
MSPRGPVRYVDSGDVVAIRGVRVMLDQRVAEAFGTETKRVNEVVMRNQDKFGPEHCFQLTENEVESLRSQIATSNIRRGGQRYLPRVFTVKGVARLATVLTGPIALRATDLILDTFLMVHQQLAAGLDTVAIAEPSRYRPTDEQRQQATKLRAKFAAAVSRLLDSIVDAEGQRTGRQVAESAVSGALRNVQERLRSKGLENAKLEADAELVLAQAEKILAEARKTNAEADGLDIANVERRIDAVKKMSDLIRNIEPDEMIGLLDQFDVARTQKRLPRG